MLKTLEKRKPLQRSPLGPSDLRGMETTAQREETNRTNRVPNMYTPPAV